MLYIRSLTATEQGLLRQRQRTVPANLASRARMIRLCCKNSRGYTMGVKPHLLFSLDRHAKDAGDERDLPQDVPFSHARYLSFPHHVHHLISL
jgi:hypothetical protein